MTTPCHACPRHATHENGGCWEHADGTEMRPGAECEHLNLARVCDHCEAAQEIAELRARAEKAEASLSAAQPLIDAARKYRWARSIYSNGLDETGAREALLLAARAMGEEGK